MAQNFPQEIIDLIVDTCWYSRRGSIGRRALKSVVLISRSWATRSRYWIFREVKLGAHHESPISRKFGAVDNEFDPRSFWSFFEMLKGGPYGSIASLIQELNIREGELSLADLLPVLSQLRNLRKLVLWKIRVIPSNDKAYLSLPRADHLAVFNLHYFEISQASIADTEDGLLYLLAFYHSCGYLKMIRCTAYDPNVDPAEPDWGRG